MPNAIALRSDFTAAALRCLARRSKDGAQARRRIHPASTAGAMIMPGLVTGRPSSSRAGGHLGARPGDH